MCLIALVIILNTLIQILEFFWCYVDINFSCLIRNQLKVHVHNLSTSYICIQCYFEYDFYAPKIKDWGILFLSCLSFYYSFCACVPTFLTLWPWPWHLIYFLKTFNHANNFSTVSARVFIFHMNILFVGIKPFDLDFFWKKNTIIHNKMINIRAFILHVSISCDKIKVFVLVTLVIFGFTTYHVDDVQIQKGLKEVTEYFHYWGVLARI